MTVRSRSPYMPSHAEQMTPSPSNKATKAPTPVTVTFLGTCSGGGPVTSRNCSSLAVDFGNNVWLFDAADGSNNRLHQSSLRMVNISRIFITHMHADHTLGVVAILAVVMSGVGQTPEGLERLRQQGLSKKADMNIYGPVGLRKFIRTQLELTRVTLTGSYAVHELVPAGATPSCGCSAEEIHVNEAPGTDFYPNAVGVWEDIVDEALYKGMKGWSVSAGPLTHRVPSIGYVLSEPAPRHPLDTRRLIPLLQENAKGLAAMDPPIKHPLSLLSYLTSLPTPPPFTLPSGDVIHPPALTGEQGRKVVIFGDCDGGTPNKAFELLCCNASLLIHECTNAAIPESILKGDKGRAVRASGLEQSLESKRDKEFDIAAKEKGVMREPWIFHGKHKSAAHAAAAADEFEEKRVQVRAKAQSRGHSTPELVGDFAYAIGARRVVVNHFSAMFPAPRYPTNETFPSLLGPQSPHPYPTPAAAATFCNIPAQPLTANELHLRVIMQALANQISAVWNGPECADHTVSGPAQHPVRLAVPSRDFMVIRIPSHELSESEHQTMREAREEIVHVVRSWANHAGVWVEREGRKDWVGYELAPEDEEVEAVSNGR